MGLSSLYIGYLLAHTWLFICTLNTLLAERRSLFGISALLLLSFFSFSFFSVSSLHVAMHSADIATLGAAISFVIVDHADVL